MNFNMTVGDSKDPVQLHSPNLDLPGVAEAEEEQVTGRKRASSNRIWDGPIKRSSSQVQEWFTTEKLL